MNTILSFISVDKQATFYLRVERREYCLFTGPKKMHSQIFDAVERQEGVLVNICDVVHLQVPGE
jgi:hypothetical protein